MACRKDTAALRWSRLDAPSVTAPASFLPLVPNARRVTGPTRFPLSRWTASGAPDAQRRLPADQRGRIRHARAPHAKAISGTTSSATPPKPTEETLPSLPIVASTSSPGPVQLT